MGMDLFGLLGILGLLGLLGILGLISVGMSWIRRGRRWMARPPEHGVHDHDSRREEHEPPALFEQPAEEGARVDSVAPAERHTVGVEAPLAESPPGR